MAMLDTGIPAPTMLPNVHNNVSSLHYKLHGLSYEFRTTGIDAYFTLRALILLATKIYSGKAFLASKC